MSISGKIVLQHTEKLPILSVAYRKRQKHCSVIMPDTAIRKQKIFHQYPANLFLPHRHAALPTCGLTPKEKEVLTFETFLKYALLKSINLFYRGRRI